MPRQERQTEVREQTQQLLQGPLKHVKAAALAAALLPLASVAVRPAVAQNCYSGGKIGDFVWHDTNNNGIQDPGEPPIQGAVVSLNGILLTGTDVNGYYVFYDLCAGTYTVAVQIPPGTQPSPANQEGWDDALDSDGVTDGIGNSVAWVTLPDDFMYDLTTDFGFWTPPVQQPGTGTPGYWKNHPEAWPVESITIGGVTYTREQAIAGLKKGGFKDKTVTMFSSLVSAKLNVLIGNDDSCVASTIAAADNWMFTYGPVGSGVHGASLAWKLGGPLHSLMDNYNNGTLCAPHRDDDDNDDERRRR